MPPPPPPPPPNRRNIPPASNPNDIPLAPVTPAPRQPVQRRAPQGGLHVGVAPAPKSSARISPLAIVAMCLGIVGLLISMFGGGILGLAAIVTGFIAMSQMNKRPLELGGKALAWIGIGVGFGSILATAYFFVGVTAFAGLNDGKHQQYCISNLRGILKSANVYANDNSDDFPTVLPPANSVVNFGGGVPSGSNADQAITSLYARALARGNVSANLYLLVLKGYTSPKHYVCPADPNAVLLTDTEPRTAFTGVENVSYSVALPWDSHGNKIGLWRSTMDAALPLIADIAPHNGDQAAGGTVEVQKIQTANLALWNSATHVGGQVVGWADAHASFERRPDLGFQQDNIWTSNNGSPSQTGNAPKYGPGVATGALKRTITDYTSGGRSSNWDVYMVPARGRDGKTY